MKCSHCIYLLLFIVCCACATIKAPDGGDQDDKGPKLLQVEPELGAKYVTARKFVFTFDEFLSLSIQPKDVFISPRPQGITEAYVSNKELIVLLPKDLEPDRTYVITLSQGIKDNNKQNPISAAFQYAFSTGGVIDSYQVRGQVFLPYTGLPQKDYLVGLYDADSVTGDTFLKRRPRYLAQTDEKGVFTLSYLAAGTYKLFGFQDTDGSYTWSTLSEGIALDDLDTVRLSYQNPGELRNLYASKPDTVPPYFLGYRSLNLNNFYLYFSEPTTSGSAIFGTDTLTWQPGTDNTPYYRDSSDQWILRLPFNDSKDTLSLQLSASDTLGNRLDTLVRLAPPKTGLQDFLELTLGTKRENPYEEVFDLTDPVNIDTFQRYVALLDSNDTLISYQVRLTNRQAIVTIPTDLTPDMAYRIRFDSLLTSVSGYRLEIPKTYAIQPVRERDFGALNGRINSSQQNLIVQLRPTGASKDKPRTSIGTTFNFEYLKPGTYNLVVIEDTDGDGRWSPGKLYPKRLSEPVVVYPEVITIRASWTQDAYEVDYPPN